MPGDTGRADVPLRPQEMDAAAHFTRYQGYPPEYFGLGPVGHSNSSAWPVPAARTSLEPATARKSASERGSEPDIEHERDNEPVREPIAGLAADMAPQPYEAVDAAAPPDQAEPITEPTAGQETPTGAPPSGRAPSAGSGSRAEQEGDARARSHTIVWKSFPKPRS